MGMVIPLGSLNKLSSSLKKSNKSIVLAGGCFDILHAGHVIFLEKAKKSGDVLIVLLESDEKVKKLKGLNRPVHTQKDRAKVLTSLSSVDFVVCLPFLETESRYNQLIAKIKPDIIAVTKGYEDSSYHKKAADLIGAKLSYVTKIFGDHSTSRILNRGRLFIKNHIN